MKKLIIPLLCVLAFGAVGAYASAPVTIAGHDSNYQIVQTTITISSSAVTTINGTVGYREATIQLLPTNLQDGTSVFFRLDGSTQSIPTLGYMVRCSSAASGGPSAVNNVTFETGGPIYCRLSSATAITSINARVTEKRLTP